jgi:ABC-type nitrate/sulfonate/bicarbonate transport system permease component
VFAVIILLGFIGFVLSAAIDLVAHLLMPWRRERSHG